MLLYVDERRFIMKIFNLEEEAKKLFTPNIINTISLIHEYKGKQDLYIESQKDSLTSLLNIAKIQSAEYSNKLEGIKTTDSRIKELVSENVAPKDRNEEEIAGYRDVLKLIHENYDNIPLTPNIILQLHKLLYKYSSVSTAGKYKMNDNVIEETNEFGEKSIRFKTVSAVEIPVFGCISTGIPLPLSSTLIIFPGSIIIFISEQYPAKASSTQLSTIS